MNDDSMNERLCTPLSDLEIEKALFMMHPKKQFVPRFLIGASEWYTGKTIPMQKRCKTRRSTLSFDLCSGC